MFRLYCSPNTKQGDTMNFKQMTYQQKLEDIAKFGCEADDIDCKDCPLYNKGPEQCKSTEQIKCNAQKQLDALTDEFDAWWSVVEKRKEEQGAV